MSAPLEIRGSVFAVDGNVDTDTIIKSRHCTSADPGTLAPHCFAELGAAAAFHAGTFPIVLCRGTFGIGSARIQAPLALAGAGVRAVIARTFAPIFFENCINGAILLPLAATLPSWPATGTHMELVVSTRELAFAWQDQQQVTLPCTLPEWALAGRSWMDIIEEQTRAAGGLEALRHRGLALR